MNVNELIAALEKWDGNMPVRCALINPKFGPDGAEAFPIDTVGWVDMDTEPVILIGATVPA